MIMDLQCPPSTPAQNDRRQTSTKPIRRAILPGRPSDGAFAVLAISFNSDGARKKNKEALNV